MKYHLNEKDQRNIFANSFGDSKPDHYFFMMILLSCIICTYGLLSNNAAIVIGAMLIAPFIGPILGGALSITTGKNDLFLMALKTILMGTVATVILATILTLILPTFELGEQVMSRTTPNILDLIIALASGAAGTYAICYRPNSATLPGVAIAVALMPPLCVAGIGLAKSDFSIMQGAILLFLANMFAINVSAILVFKLAGFSADISTLSGGDVVLQKSMKHRLLFSIILLVIIAIPLGIFLSETYEKAHTEKVVKESLNESLSLLAPDSELVSVKFAKSKGKSKGGGEKSGKEYKINAVFRTTKVIMPQNIRQMANLLEYQLGELVTLDADVILIQKVNTTESRDAFKEVIPRETVEIVKSAETAIEEAITEKISLLPPEINARFEDFSFQYNHDGTHTYYVNVYVTTSKPLEEKFVKTLDRVLEDKLKRQVVVQVFRALPEEK